MHPRKKSIVRCGAIASILACAAIAWLAANMLCARRLPLAELVLMGDLEGVRYICRWHGHATSLPPDAWHNVRVFPGLPGAPGTQQRVIVEHKRVVSLLHGPILRGDLEMARTLLHAGADLETLDVVGWSDETGGGAFLATPLYTSVFHGRTRITELLLDSGADPNAPSGELYPILSSRSQQDTEFLLAAGADPNQISCIGSFPIHTAAVLGDPGILIALIRAGAKANATDADGMTALHIAAMFGRVEAVRALLKHGARADVKDAHGKTPIDYARSLASDGERGQPDEALKARAKDCVALLRELGHEH